MTSSLLKSDPKRFAVGFWRRTKLDGHCLLWIGASFVSGYGKVNSGGKMKRAHRVAWELVYGEIPEGLSVCHRCDRPACINPDHLFLGTHKQNMTDCKEKGRFNPERGEERYCAKLDAGKVRAIRASSQGTSVLAKIYGVNTGTIANIRNFKRWKHVT